MSVDWAKHWRATLSRLGEDVTIRPAAGSAAYTVRGIYTEAYAEAALGGEVVGIASSRPRFVTMSADIASLVEGDLLQRSSDSFGYRVVAPEPARLAGVAVLQLHSEAE
jgi:hypothetical protein